MLANAAAGSEKNIVPKRLIPTSNPAGSKRCTLGVAQLVADVVEPLGRRHLTGSLEHALGHVDADDAARRRGAGRLASRQPGSAPDVEHLVTGADPVRGAKVLVVSPQLGVVEVEAVRRRHRDDAMDLSVSS